MADADETLEINDTGYPLLPDNVLSLHLGQKKGMVRQFVGAVQCYYELPGRIPWNDIADNPSNHLGERSRLDSDHRLMDPSHMKVEGVDDYLKHWLKMQKMKKCPLTLKDLLITHSDQSIAPAKESRKGKGKGKGKARATSRSSRNEDSDNDDGDNQQDVEKEEDAASNEAKSINSDSTQTVSDDEDIPQAGSSLPRTLASAAQSKKTHLAFLKSLSNDKYYTQLIKLLYAAKSGPLPGTPGLGWASWTSTDHFLPKEFHKVKGSGLLSRLKAWLHSDPLTMDDDNLASYSHVEIVALAVGLAMRDIWVIQFPENFSGIPGHVTNSPFEFREYEQLLYDTKTLIDGYDDLLAEIAKAYLEKKSSVDKTNGDINKTNGQQLKGRCSQPGLTSVLSIFQPIQEEIGLSGESWTDHGECWQALAALWLRAEALRGVVVAEI